MNGQDFLRIIKEAFVPFLAELDFVMGEPSISGRVYRVVFASLKHFVSISFEPGEKSLFVWVSTREGGELAAVDDRSKTLRLSDLNSRYMKTVTEDQRASNDALFKSVVVKDEEEKALLKCAKQLRLVLPKYLAEYRDW